jgi:hypothetical protein
MVTQGQARPVTNALVRCLLILTPLLFVPFLVRGRPALGAAYPIKPAAA